MFWFFVCSTFHRCSTQKSCGYTLGLYLLFSELGENMLYKILKTSPEVLSDLVSLTNGDLETTINAARHAVSLLCDPKGKFKSCHHDLNMLRVKLVTSKDDSLSRIPPREPSFKQQFG
jgi:hypothetical protein